MKIIAEIFRDFCCIIKKKQNLIKHEFEKSNYQYSDLVISNI
jgi:hypothetical protein